MRDGLPTAAWLCRENVPVISCSQTSVLYVCHCRARALPECARPYVSTCAAMLASRSSMIWKVAVKHYRSSGTMIASPECLELALQLDWLTHPNQFSPELCS